MSVQVDDRPHLRLSRRVAVQRVVDRQHVPVRQVVHPAHRDRLTAPRLERGAGILAVVAPERRSAASRDGALPEDLHRDLEERIAVEPAVRAITLGIGSASTKGFRLACASARRARTNAPPLPSATAPPAAPPHELEELPPIDRSAYSDLLTSSARFADRSAGRNRRSLDAALGRILDEVEESME